MTITAAVRMRSEKVEQTHAYREGKNSIAEATQHQRVESTQRDGISGCNEKAWAQRGCSSPGRTRVHHVHMGHRGASSTPGSYSHKQLLLTTHAGAEAENPRKHEPSQHPR